MSKFSFWQKWLLTAGLAITGFGIVMSLVSGTPLFDLFNRQIDPAFWPANAVDEAARQFQQWIYGVWGATIAGFGILVTFIARHPFSRKEKWAWSSILWGVVAWFVLDSGLSFFYKVYFNVIFNVVLFILVTLPLIFTRRDVQ